MKKPLICVGVLCIATSIGLGIWLMPREAVAQVAAQPKLQGFTLANIRFDESVGDKKPTPVIPKDWKFVAVSSGEKANSNNLWFQDAVGNIYMVQGFTSNRKFIVSEQIQKLAAQ